MIQTQNLSKRYGKFEALKNVNLSIQKGSVYGFIGPNGAGKSTTMMILATLLPATSGKAYVGGYDVEKEPREVKQLLGYMPDFFGVYDNLKATEYLDFYARAYNIPARNRSNLIADLLDLVNLSNKADAYVDHLSRGMKQRLGLARCLVHSPEILILDEPASGLDPRARIEMREILKKLQGMGKTILISSHILPELAELCDEIGVIEKGQLIANGAVNEVSTETRGISIMQVKTLGNVELAERILQASPFVRRLDNKNSHFRFHFTGTPEEKVILLQQLIQANIPVTHFADSQENLEDVFLAITEGVGN
ncbi:ABC transporter ATP-binding protein [Brevibacillus laterosporus]|uniref:ABC-type multidrug transport system, ATPase n=1 Tax=Brevibacillus laterosporus LMG 15441 TaxID=1042163 RepID=A0A075R7K4_BRELA|nr:MULTISPECIES: ABC transporter ATP-binding protein [Brevibacillus]AIG27168.1 ABC-type multidrug transport system, ATPase [Brevibacillus laterosporus LMG 15441]AUM65573.1 ABC transporter ATP-binding protein [Brevibacillus laterosporus]MCR8962833.1 ABC transporter ATP-binding protein [Brevibacillus laterosporus]MCZ0834988.1 ABC transporter ATP-binding protein [Brevibacillus halotolerans]RJL11618.1 ABC transporter ATP-binding protein [Brevibacillus laterosporus]